MDNTQSESSLSEEDDNMNADKQHFLDKVTIFKIIHENRCENGKDILSDSRIKSLNEIKALYDNLEYAITFDEYMIKTSFVRWLNYYRQDMKYCELWDKKEALMVKHRTSRAREADRIMALQRRADVGHRYTSRSRGRSRDGNSDDDKDKEHVK